MNILVTGGAGYIGSHTIVELIEAGHTPISIDNLSNSRIEVYDNLKTLTGQDIDHYEDDVRDTDKLIEIIKKHNCDAVIHFAAFKAVGESVQKPLKYYDNNLQSTASLLNAMDQTGMKNLVFSSSCTVYGDPDEVPLTEDSPLQPAANPYGATKQISETMITDVANATDIKSILLRYFNPIGAHPSSIIGELPLGAPNCLVPYLTQSVAGERDPLTVFGDDYDTEDGTAIRDYIHVVDLAKAHVASLDYLEKTEDDISVFNIGTGTGTSVLGVINTFEDVNDMKVDYKIGPRREGDAREVYASVDKASKDLGWTSELSIEDALKDAWNWQKTLS